MIALSEKQQFLEDEVVDKEVEKKKFMKIQLSKLKRLLKRLMNEWKPAPSPFHATMHLADEQWPNLTQSFLIERRSRYIINRKKGYYCLASVLRMTSTTGSRETTSL